MSNLVLSGYGKMGKEIEKLAQDEGWIILATIDNQKEWDLKNNEIMKADVIIDFSIPDVVMDNIQKAFALNIPIVVGTTGWNGRQEEIKNLCESQGKTLVFASNFSIGVNMFFEINKHLAQMMNHQQSYEVDMEEIHHTQKLDSPSGTAITLANQIIENLKRKNKYINQSSSSPQDVSIISKRIDKVPGTHIIRYHSAIDEIEIRHTAKSRRGFAEGALWAARWAIGEKGFFNFKDILFNKL